MGKRVTTNEFRGLFVSGRPVKISEIAGRLGIARPTVSKLMKRHGTFTSVNCGGAYCVLPHMCRFDERGFATVRKMLFFRDGNQLAAIVRLVDTSQKGLTLPEINAFFGIKAAMQMLKLTREARVVRVDGPDRLVYFSTNEQVARRQQESRSGKSEIGSRELSLTERLATESRDQLEVLSKVLLVLVRKPGSSAKSIALSLQRQGEKITTEKVRGLFKKFDIAKKNS